MTSRCTCSGCGHDLENRAGLWGCHKCFPLVDEVERLHVELNQGTELLHRSNVAAAEDAKTLAEHRAENERLRAALETERQRLSACGVAAIGYFEDCLPEYKSASLSDTLKLYAEKERLRAENFAHNQAYAALLDENEKLKAENAQQAETIAKISEHNVALSGQYNCAKYDREQLMKRRDELEAENAELRQRKPSQRAIDMVHHAGYAAREEASKHMERQSNKLQRIRALVGELPHTDHGVQHAVEIDYCLSCEVRKALDEEEP